MRALLIDLRTPEAALIMGQKLAQDPKHGSIEMADVILCFREMQGFDHDMNLTEAYRWQGEFVENRPLGGRFR